MAYSPSGSLFSIMMHVDPDGDAPSNLRLKLAALLSKEALCCLMFEMSAAA